MSKPVGKNEDLGLEKSMEKLEDIVTQLESGDHTLEDSLKKFEVGLTLGKQCREILDKAELRVRKLIAVDEDGEMTTEEIDGD